MLAALDLVARMVPQLSVFVWPAGAALGGLACLWGTWALSRAAGFGPQAALASGLILLSSLLFPQLAHFMGPQGLATGLCLLSMAFFCMGWKKEHAWISLPLAFLTSGLAALTGGLVFLLAIVLFASIRERLVFADYPKCWDGFPIALITAGLIALAFMGFSGLQVWPM